MATQSVSLMMTGTGLSTALGTSSAEIVGVEIGDFSIDMLETTHQGTSSAGASAFRTYIVSALQNSGTVTVTYRWNGETTILGTEITPLKFYYERGVTDIDIIEGNAALTAWSSSHQVGELVTAVATFKFKGTVDIGA